MKSKIIYHLCLGLILTAFIFPSCTKKNNWPQFRGPSFNLVVNNEKLPTEWGDSLNIRWSADVEGDGWSSPIVIDDRIYYTTSILLEKAPAEEAKSENEGEQQTEDNSYQKDIYQFKVVCVDLISGEEIWNKVSFEGNPRIKKHASSNYAGESPVSDGNKIYAYFGMHGIYCYDLDGTLLWEKDLGAYETKNGWGTGSSPVVYNGTLYVQVDNEEESFLAALDTNTGDEKWRVARDEKTNYATPVIWQNNVRTELVTMGVTARSYNPDNGELLWQLSLGGDQSIPSPVFDQKHLYLGNVPGRNEHNRFFCVKAGAEGNITPGVGETSGDWIAWLDTTITIGNPSPILYDGKVYVLSSRGGGLACLDALTGSIVYNEKISDVGACWASPWINNNNIYFYDERGTTQVVLAGEQFEVLSQNLLSGKFWSSVAVTDDAYIVRGAEKLYSIGH